MTNHMKGSINVNRRTFLTTMAATGAALLANRGRAQQTPSRPETEPGQKPTDAPASPRALDWGNVDAFRHFPDSVGLVAEWYSGKTLWETPYRSLLPKRVRGLLAAGRCMASGGRAWSVMRVIQAAAMTGEVCGLAAARSVERGITPDRIDLPWLQGELVKRKFVLDVREIKTEVAVTDAPAIAVPNATFYE